tara:strand:+ start:1784 stop:2191 length:408 start_codon:yes stop_codon:yes gene_type:complete
MSVEIMKAVYAHLTGGSNAFASAVGDRIFFAEAPAGTALPLAVYTMSPPAIERFFDDDARHTSEVTVSILSLTDQGADAAADIEALLYARLQGVTLSATGFDRALVRCLDRGTPEVDGEALRVDSSFEVIAVDPA